MADEATAKTVSARGAFFIGLVLGVGVVLIFSILKTGQLQEELNTVKNDLALMRKEVGIAKTDYVRLKNNIPDVVPAAKKAD